jgi:hypothetical protein
MARVSRIRIKAGQWYETLLQAVKILVRNPKFPKRVCGLQFTPNYPIALQSLCPAAGAATRSAFIVDPELSTASRISTNASFSFSRFMRFIFPFVGSLRYCYPSSANIGSGSSKSHEG